MGGQIQPPRNIVVYVRPNCPECDQVVRYLENRGLSFQVRDLDRDEDALEDMDALGYTDVPVTFLDDAAVVGFDTNRLDALLVNITL